MLVKLATSVTITVYCKIKGSEKKMAWRKRNEEEASNRMVLLVTINTGYPIHAGGFKAVV